MLDSSGGGFVPQTFISYVFARKYDASTHTLALVFFAIGILQDLVAVVEPSERTAAAAYTNADRYLARPIAPLLAGVALRGALGTPFLIAGTLKSVYDIGLYRSSGRARAPVPEARGTERRRSRTYPATGYAASPVLKTHRLRAPSLACDEREAEVCRPTRQLVRQDVLG